ncbi:hypothetical protein BC936DRAFT_149876 [Jimgerdemannia flammicorona]|uniref:Uncharacterized protein n=1 Tax=Jimgerdemannia flammicorona TaxID=994334 RepID=A0A433D002_9FUNG|nr:hypothetical protein BC936DRAFT_149876 [Jimgerdemannia flammicorona]
MPTNPRKGQTPYNTLTTTLNSEAKKSGGSIVKEGTKFKLRERSRVSSSVVANDDGKTTPGDQTPTRRSRQSNDLDFDDGDSEPESDGGSELENSAGSTAPVTSGTLSPSSRVAATLDQMRLDDNDSEDELEIECRPRQNYNSRLQLDTTGSFVTVRAIAAAATSRSIPGNQTTAPDTIVAASKPVAITNSTRPTKQQPAQLSSTRTNPNRIRSLATSSTPVDSPMPSPLPSPTNSASKAGGSSRKASSANPRAPLATKQSPIASGRNSPTTSPAPPTQNPSSLPPKPHSRKRPPSPTKQTIITATTAHPLSKSTTLGSPQKSWNTSPATSTTPRNRPPSPPTHTSRPGIDHSETDADHSVEDNDEDDSYPTPSTLKEKRARAARRAEQLKKWRVREDREARELRAVARRKLVAENGNGRLLQREGREGGSVSSGDEREREKAKSVKFNLRRNIVFEFDSDADVDGTSTREGKAIGIVERVKDVLAVGPTAMEVN